MSYKTVSISHLMVHEFGQVEGALNQLTEKALEAVIPSGMKFNAFIEQLKQGHLVLLTDLPTTPLLVFESEEFGQSKTWSLNSQAADHFEPAAQNAYLARAQMIGSSAPSSSSGRLHPPLPMPPYIPEPPIRDNVNKKPPLKYEYSFEIACSNKSFRRASNYAIKLTKTANEGALGNWLENRTEHGTRYTTHCAFNEPKRLLMHVASSTVGISPNQPVKVKKIGAHIADEGFIPVKPAVQLGERLGFPTEGFYYHFHNTQLIQEYRIIGDKNWTFYGTRTSEHLFSSERRYNVDQSAILVWWKQGGKLVKNQYLVYLERQITPDELNNVTEQWLNEHGIKLDIPELLAATKQPIIKRPDKDKKSTHIVRINPNTGRLENWNDIARQHDLSPEALLALNPQYDGIPEFLKHSASLCVKKPSPPDPSPIHEIPPQSPQRYNQPLNTYYRHSERYLEDTTLVAISTENYVDKEIPVVNVKTIRKETHGIDVQSSVADQSMASERHTNDIEKELGGSLFKVTKDGWTLNWSPNVNKVDKSDHVGLTEDSFYVGLTDELTSQAPNLKEGRVDPKDINDNLLIQGLNNSVFRKYTATSDVYENYTEVSGEVIYSLRNINTKETRFLKKERISKRENIFRSATLRRVTFEGYIGVADLPKTAQPQSYLYLLKMKESIGKNIIKINMEEN